MNHPFFDVPEFPLHRAEAQELVRLLTIYTDERNRIKTLYRQAHRNAIALNMAQSGDLIWTEALGSLTLGGHLERFLTMMAAIYTNQLFLSVVQQIKDARPEYQRRIMPGGMLVFDRNPIRDLIGSLASDDYALKVLVLHGADGAGKTHCRYIFEASAKANGGAPFYFCDPIVTTLADILRELFGYFHAIDKIPASNTTGAAWHKQVIQQLSDLARNAGVVLWIAIDDLAKEGSSYFLDPDIKGFFDQLSLLLLAPQYRPNFRLMLIQYPENLPTKWNAETYAVCPIAAGDIGKNDITELLREHIVAQGKQMHDTAIESLADTILQESGDPADEEWLGRLNYITKSKLRTI